MSSDFWTGFAAGAFTAIVVLILIAWLITRDDGEAFDDDEE